MGHEITRVILLDTPVKYGWNMLKQLECAQL